MPEAVDASLDVTMFFFQINSENFPVCLMLSVSRDERNEWARENRRVPSLELSDKEQPFLSFHFIALFFFSVAPLRDRSFPLLPGTGQSLHHV